MLQIFYQHARSREAKLQVALAEIPYLKNRLMIDHEYERGNKHSSSRMGEQYYDTQKFILKRLEAGIKRRIGEIKKQRVKLRSSRKESEICTVAVIGYTNCGKTSLIKALTGDKDLVPRDQLFATLDVTCHGTKLPGSNLETVFIDTVGFISDIPTPLIASFSATLEDALDADLLLHLVDFSHPDHPHQIGQVLATLAKLKIKQSDKRLITVANKIDLVQQDKWREISEQGYLPVSSVKSYGLEFLVKRIEKRLIEVSEMMELKMRVVPGSEEWEWLRDHSAVGRIEHDTQTDTNYNLVNIIISQSNFAKFKSRFLHHQ